MTLDQVKRNLGKRVIWHNPRDGSRTAYHLVGCILRKDEESRFYYQAELRDIESKHSSLIAALEDIEELKGE